MGYGGKGGKELTPLGGNVYMDGDTSQDSWVANHRSAAHIGLHKTGMSPACTVKTPGL